MTLDVSLLSLLLVSLLVVVTLARLIQVPALIALAATITVLGRAGLTNAQKHVMVVRVYLQAPSSWNRFQLQSPGQLISHHNILCIIYRIHKNSDGECEHEPNCLGLADPWIAWN